MTEFETKLLKLLEETNTQICNVHTQLYEIDQTLGNAVDAIKEVDRAIMCTEPSDYGNNLSDIAKNLAEISLDVSDLEKCHGEINEKL